MVRILSGLTYIALFTQAISAASIPDAHINALDVLEAHAGSAPRSADIVSPDHTLEKRKGGGGRGGGSSSSSSSSSGGGRSSGGSSSSSSRTSSSSFVGGSTRLGSGPSRSYGRGGYYGGGAAVPYQAGSRTPKGLVAGALIAPIAILAIMPGLWLYSVYPYYYNNPYRFYNRTATNHTNTNNDARSLLALRQEATGANQTLPVVCLCQDFAVCGCDENTDQQYISDLVGDGDYSKLNKSLITVSDVNGTRTLVLNGSLPNGTTAPGGVDDAAASLAIGKYSGYWAMGLIVLYGVFI
ncbi:hypothetical protein EK21DRAFT_109288 [Setomelanomma holmii]|uniref:DUF7732 domain-containing protein n=1 Tax=Setomelanomma holmii TaxID=210430 RepID=A0A9P4LQV9_9PLEO|nr:hypothetical protein EK21DRAFT_109288 [Setomelanomma holmii]